jgi:hypothetical protein
MLALFKNILLLTSLLCLSACWPLEDDKSSSGSSLLPDVNTNLSTESPVGIWMLDIDATSEVTYYEEDSSNIKSIEKSKHKIRQLISISQAENESYLMRECSIKRKPNVILDSVFFTPSFAGGEFLSSLSAFSIKGNVLSYFFELADDSMQLKEAYGHMGTWPLNSQASLELDHNLSLQGNASQLIKNRSSSFSPLSSYPESWDQINNLDIKGVKVSDSTNFSQSRELTTEFTINDIPFLDTEETAMDCLRIENINTFTSLNSPDTTQEVIQSSKKLIYADFNHPNAILLRTDEANTPEGTSLSVFADDSLFLNLNSPILFPTCKNLGCQKIIEVKANIKESPPNGIGGTITASQFNGEDIQIEISASIK